MPFIGFNFPSHTHDVVPFLTALISKGLSETITVSEALTYFKFQVRPTTETITVNEALIRGVIKTRALTQTITVSEAPVRVSNKSRALTQTVIISELLA